MPDVDIGPDGSEAAEAAELVQALEAWQQQWEQTVAVAEADANAGSELTTLLDGATLTELEEATAALRAEHEQLVRHAEAASRKSLEAVGHRNDAARLAGVQADGAADVDYIGKLRGRAREQLVASRERCSELTGAVEHAVGGLQERARALASVPEAEEVLETAKTELARVTTLAQTLNLTQPFLTAAQEQVHRDIAPVLTGTLRSWLPDVTGGRYVDATVNPATLQVQVCGQSRRWRHADRLSVGTAEQVYLLLRVALAQHLATAGEQCPLLLDDVAAQADPDRAREILELLLRLSEGVRWSCLHSRRTLLHGPASASMGTTSMRSSN